MSRNSAEGILDGLGGSENILSMTHCATRLRFQVADASKIDGASIEKIDEVMGVVPQGQDRYQVVVGAGVQDLYNKIKALPSMVKGGGSSSTASDLKDTLKGKGPRGKFAWLDSFFEILSDSFRPTLPALLGASFFITFMALMGTLHIVPNWADPRTTLSPTWQFINLTWKSVFVFLPLMVAYNASKKMGADPWVGFSIMAVVMLPDFLKIKETPGALETLVVGKADLEIVRVFGHIPLVIFDYGSKVFPPLLMAAVLGMLYKQLKKIIPSSVQLIFVPFFSFLIMMPLTAFLIAPIGAFLGLYLGQGLSAINNLSPIIFAIIIPLAYPFMVPLGLHWPLNAVMLANISSLGYDFIQGPMGAWNFACYGATAGVLFCSIRDKDLEMRQTATGALFAGLIGGISEPSLYGIHLRFKKIYSRMLPGCAIGGLIIGIGGGVNTKAFVFSSLLTIPAFENIPLYAAGVIAAFLVAMFLVISFGYKSKEPALADGDEAASRTNEDNATPSSPASSTPAPDPADKPLLLRGHGEVVDLLSPLEGKIIPLKNVPDPVFSQGILGAGIAIEPTGTTVYAPGAGTVKVAHKTGHAFGIALDSGAEILIHIGIDTVKLEGKGFDVKVAVGDRVTSETPLVTFDPKIIQEAGYPIVTPFVVTNARKFASIEPIKEGTITVGEPLLAITAKKVSTSSAS